MLQEASSVTKDPSVLRRLVFAASSLHCDMPNYWKVITEFGFKTARCSCSEEEVKILIENIHFIDKSALDSDSVLWKELCDSKGFGDHTLGVVLVSSKTTCDLCGEHLLVREDRPSFPIIYTENGTLSGTHFRKYCSKQWMGCPFTQHYGYHQRGNTSECYYDDNCLELTYFLSSNVTAFQMKIMHSLSAEILLGQLSYKQKAEIYNYLHGYDSSTKKGPTPLHFEEHR